MPLLLDEELSMPFDIEPLLIAPVESVAVGVLVALDGSLELEGLVI